MKPQVILIIIGSIIAIFAIGVYGYVFIAGAPQIDRPQIKSAQQTGLSFQIQTFESKAMQGRRSYGVILPPNYQQQSNQRYPVIFLLHGGHDNERAFYDKYAITNVLDDLYRANKLPPSIIITPDGNDRRGASPLYDPDYFNGPNGQIDTLIGIELVTEVKRRYRTALTPQQWAIGGFSSGGWGAVNIGLHHLDTFGTLFSHSGYFTDDSGPQNSPAAFIVDIPAAQRKNLHIYLDAGDNAEDAVMQASSAQFHQILNKLGIRNVFYVFPGGHGISGPDIGWNYIHKHLYDSLSYVGRQFRR